MFGGRSLCLAADQSDESEQEDSPERVQEELSLQLPGQLNTDGIEVDMFVDGSTRIQVFMDQEQDRGVRIDKNEHIFKEIEGLAAKKQWEEAIEKLSPIVKSHPEDKDAKVILASVLAEMGREKDALNLLGTIIETGPDDFRVLNNAAWYYATVKDRSLRDAAKAIDYARRAIFLKPKSYQIWSTLAESHYVNGEFEKALIAAHQALELATSQGAEFDRLTEYRVQISRSKQAVSAFSLQR